MSEREPSAPCRPIKFFGEGGDEMPRMETPNVNIGLLLVPRRRSRNKDGIPRWADGRTEETL